MLAAYSMQNPVPMEASRNLKALTPAERVDYSKFYDLLMKRRAELLNLNERDRKGVEQRQTTGESPGDLADESVMDATSDYFLRLAERDRRELIEVRDALEKIHRGTYGLCENCQEEIPVERLSQLPYAKLCIDCQLEREARERVHRLRSATKL